MKTEKMESRRGCSKRHNKQKTEKMEPRPDCSKRHNKQLGQRLERMDRRVTRQKHREGSDVLPTDGSSSLPSVLMPNTPATSIILTIPPEDITEGIDLNNTENSEADNAKVEPVESNIGIASLKATTSSTSYVAKRSRTEKETESGASSEPRRKRKVSWTSSSVHSDIASDGRRTPKAVKKNPLKATRTLQKLKPSTMKGCDSSVEETLWPYPKEIQYMEGTERPPPSAFGIPIPDFTPSEFSLPWLTSARTGPPTTLPVRRQRSHGGKK